MKIAKAHIRDQSAKDEPVRGGSTWHMIREARRTPGYPLADLLHGLFYARWPYLYISIGVGEHPVARLYKRISSFLGRFSAQPMAANGERSGTVADGYHGKVLPTESARRLVRIEQNLQIPDLEQVIPYPRARSLILRNPDHIAVLDCPCRSAREAPCSPLDVCLIIGEPFASFVIDHHPSKARWISAEEAEAILQAEHDRGHVHHAFFKDAMFDRFYAICNCCDCCCGAMQAQRSGSPMLASSGYVCEVDRERCVDCGDCEELCPFHAIRVDIDGCVVDREACMGCGVCADACFQEALHLVRAPDRGIPLEIETLVSAAIRESDPIEGS